MVPAEDKIINDALILADLNNALKKMEDYIPTERYALGCYTQSITDLKRCIAFFKEYVTSKPEVFNDPDI